MAHVFITGSSEELGQTAAQLLIEQGMSYVMPGMAQGDEKRYRQHREQKRY